MNCRAIKKSLFTAGWDSGRIMPPEYYVLMVSLPEVSPVE
jgi:hypothetical protein